MQSGAKSVTMGTERLERRRSAVDKQKLLVVEDDRSIAVGLEYSLGQEGFGVTLCAGVADALEALKTERFDLAVLDLSLPDGSGYDVCRAIKRQGDMPVIFLTARDDEVSVVMGLDMGADDYITKPFLPQELLLRLAAVLRRVYGAGAGEVLRLGAAEVHWGTGTVRRPGGGEVALTAKEYALLKKLAANRGNIVTIDALCQALWEGPMVGYENTLMVHIRRLREKLETDPSHPQYLLTVRGLGYRLAQEERP